MGKDRAAGGHDRTAGNMTGSREVKPRIGRREPDEDRNRSVNPDSGRHAPAGGCGHGDTSGRQHEARLFGATYMTRNNPYFDVLNEGIEEVVEANGDILLTRDPLQDQEKQNEQIQEMIDEGIQMLF